MEIVELATRRGEASRMRRMVLWGMACSLIRVTRSHP